MDTENAFKLILSKIQNFNSYHDHKEQMAYRIVLYYLLGLTALVIKGSSVWKNFNCPKIHCVHWENMVIGIVFFLTMILAFIYVGWQFGKRRFASDMVTAGSNLATRWVVKPPTKEDFEPKILNNSNWSNQAEQFPKSLVDEFYGIRASGGFFSGPKPSEWMTYLLMGIWTIAACIRIW